MLLEFSIIRIRSLVKYLSTQVLTLLKAVCDKVAERQPVAKVVVAVQ